MNWTSASSQSFDVSSLSRSFSANLKMPRKLESYVGEKGFQMSGGQQQRPGLGELLLDLLGVGDGLVDGHGKVLLDDVAGQLEGLVLAAGQQQRRLADALVGAGRLLRDARL